jgi:hypothetical protein
LNHRIQILYQPGDGNSSRWGHFSPVYLINKDNIPIPETQHNQQKLKTISWLSPIDQRDPPTYKHKPSYNPEMNIIGGGPKKE